MKISTSVALQILEIAKQDPNLNIKNIVFWDAEDGMYKSLASKKTEFLIAIDLYHPSAVQVLEQALLLFQIIFKNTDRKFKKRNIESILMKLKGKEIPIKIVEENVTLLIYNSLVNPEYIFFHTKSNYIPEPQSYPFKELMQPQEYNQYINVREIEIPEEPEVQPTKIVNQSKTNQSFIYKNKVRSNKTTTGDNIVKVILGSCILFFLADTVEKQFFAQKK